MKKLISIVLVLIIFISEITWLIPVDASAEEKEEIIVGKTYDLGEEDKYDISKGKDAYISASRFSIKGDMSEVSKYNGFDSFAVSSGNLALMINKEYCLDLYKNDDVKKWHIIDDKSKTVDSTKLTQNVGSGAIVVQTSRDGKSWITVDKETDIYNKWETINNRNKNGELYHAFYKTTNVQLTNGCYYRIVVAYKLQRELEPLKIGFVNVKKTEQKERIEIYQFYAYDPSVNRAELLDTKSMNVYRLGDVKRTDNEDGFKKSTDIETNDPHNDWTIGNFYISGYTKDLKDGDTPVFLKVPEDKVALWFVLEQELDKCNGNPDIQVNYTDSGSDVYFSTPKIEDFGRGALIIRRTDKRNQPERKIYTNYLEASATVGANTRVDLFEEGDYEVALDYQLHFDKPFVFGTTTPKVLSYRVFFKFKVRNGDISAFLRDIDTNRFITSGNVAPHGFYIDVAQSKYLYITYKREILSESLDGIILDTKEDEVALEGRYYTEEGIYTITVNNLATGSSVTKKVYVGDRDILLVHMKTGMPINEINERLAAGAYIDENGKLVDPTPIVEPEVEENNTDVLGEINTTESELAEQPSEVIGEQSAEDVEEQPVEEVEEQPTEEIEGQSVENVDGQPVEVQPTEEPEENKPSALPDESNNKSEEDERPGRKRNTSKVIGIISLLVVSVVYVLVQFKKRSKNKSAMNKGGK